MAERRGAVEAVAMTNRQQRCHGDYWEQRRVLITGSTGFIGSHLTRQLAGLGAEVFAFMRPSSQRLRIADVLDGVHTIEGDLQDPESVRTAVERADPELVYHLAAFGVDRPSEDPRQAVLVNVMGTVHLLEAVRERHLRRFIYIGTCYEYACGENPIGPDTSLAPANIYAATKSGGALACRSYERVCDLPLVIVRPFQSYGPWQSIRQLIPYVIVSLLEGEDVRVTSGRQTRDFVFIDDLVNALLLVSERDDAVGQTFNLGSGRGTPVRTVVERIVELLGGDGTVEFGAMPHRPAEIWDIWSDNTRAHALLGWSPDCSLTDGLGNTINWYRANLHLVHQLTRR